MLKDALSKLKIEDRDWFRRKQYELLQL